MLISVVDLDLLRELVVFWGIFFRGDAGLFLWVLVLFGLMQVNA